jgi:hypothetical protein
MDRSFGLARLTQAAAAAMALSPAGVGGALAEELYHPGRDDAFGAQQDASVSRAASAPRDGRAQDAAGRGETFKLERNDAFGA